MATVQDKIAAMSREKKVEEVLDNVVEQLVDMDTGELREMLVDVYNGVMILKPIASMTDEELDEELRGMLEDDEEETANGAV